MEKEIIIVESLKEMETQVVSKVKEEAQVVDGRILEISWSNWHKNDCPEVYHVLACSPEALARELIGLYQKEYKEFREIFRKELEEVGEKVFPFVVRLFGKCFCFSSKECLTEVGTEISPGKWMKKLELLHTFLYVNVDFWKLPEIKVLVKT